MDAETHPEEGPEARARRDLERAEADLRRAEQEVEKALQEVREAARHDEVTIVVDGTERRVRGGAWVVAALKEQLGIPAAKVLAVITPSGLDDLADDATIEVCEGERFMSHARSGGSS
jgi:hypothetical protein